MEPLEHLLSPLIDNLKDTSQKLSEKEIQYMDKITQQKIDLLKGRIKLSEVDTVRPEIAESWIRSQKLGVDLFHYPNLPMVSKESLEERYKEKENFIKASDPFISKLENMFANTNCIVLLTDEQGIILRVVIGNNIGIEKLNNYFQLVPGAIWREDTVGTCSHALSILLQSPIQICGPEHYCQAFEQTTCSSAPVLDANNNLEGTLSIASPYLHEQNSHSFGLAVSMAWAIQNEIQLSEKNELLNTTITTKSEAVLAVNRNGVVINANSAANKIFSQDLIGQKVVDIFDNQPSINSILKNGRSLYDLEIKINKSNQHYLLSAEPAKNKFGKSLGCVLTFRSSENQRKHTKKMEGLQTRFTFDKLIGDSSQILASINMAKKFAPIDANILIQGESGTGKEMYAQCIHNESRPNGPFIAENCAAIPKTLIESELFGYEGGAFTGAERQGRPGKIELADGGTLFLDEIGDMPLELQAVLLRVLEEKIIKRVGGSKYIPVDFRLVTATNKDLLDLVRKDQFREDLYYRLAVFKISIPPLRERGQDILKLLDHFVSQFAQKQCIPIPTLSKEAKYLLLQYNWPGNVRQLQNAILFAVNMSKQGIIHPEDFPEEIYKSVNLPDQSDKKLLHKAKTDNTNRFAVKELEKVAIEQALTQTNHNIAQASELLGMSKSTLYRKIKLNGLLY